jgi:3-deoxy-manno-octulosonate cytidylyltransferase (CMP-KDO synthetase)
MKKIAVIPARYASVRFPGKLMQMLGERTIITTTYQNTVATNLFDDILVVTDSDIIYNEIKNAGGNVVMSNSGHQSGSDRIAEAIEDVACDVVLNVQGDEPFVDKQALQSLLNAFDDSSVKVASLMHKMFEQADVENSNNVKVVIDKNSNALLFSRSVIPFIRDKNVAANYYKHIGIYAYRKDVLIQFTKWKQTPLELAEKLEQLRYLENGVSIKMILTDHISIGIDTAEDLELAKQYLSEKKYT